MSGETYPVWTSVNEVTCQRPWLDSDISCEVCVIGGGITGALCALKLAERGEDVVLITAGQLGYCATADALPTAEYDFGQRLIDAKRRVGIDKAVRFFELGARAIDYLELLSGELDGDFGFRRCDSLLYTHDERELELFNREYLMRRHNGFDCSFVNRQTARDIYSFDIAGGIISKNLAAQLDPYRLTQLCAKRAVELGARVYENTKAERLDSSGETVVIDVSTRKTILADRAVLAIGNDFEELIGVNTRSSTSFYAVSEPVEDFEGWCGKSVVRMWGPSGVTLTPTPDGRVFCSGLESTVIDRQGRLCGVVAMPALWQRRFTELEEAARCHFPSIEMPEFEFRRMVTSIEAHDRLPIIGKHEDHDNCYFACCTGAGAIASSLLAAELLADMITDGYCDDELLFSPMRFISRQARVRK